MVCIFCGSATAVVNSRHKVRDNHIWRRRLCLSCQAIFTTNEQADLSSTVVVRGHDNHLSPFSRDKLFIALYESCKHRETAVADATALTQIIVTDLIARASQGVIDRANIKETAHTVLQRLDPAAATFYAAYHPLDATS